MKTPWLIQRMKFKTPPSGTTFDGILSMDYMGSAEFEFGSLPDSLKVLCSGVDKLVVVAAPSASFSDRHKAVLHLIALSDEDAVCYMQDYLPGILEYELDRTYKTGIKLKEFLYIRNNITGLDFSDKPIDPKKDYQTVDAWWDLDNHVIFTFGRENAERIVAGIRATRDKKKTEGKKGWF